MKKEDLFERINTITTEFANAVIDKDELENRLKQLKEFVLENENNINLLRILFHNIMFNITSVLGAEFYNLEIDLRIEKIKEDE